MAIEKLVIGKTYLVIQPNCHLTKLIREGIGIWRFIKRRLRPGDLIQYYGQEQDLRHFNKPHDVFSKDGFRGWFYPHNPDTGSADRGSLEEVDNQE